MEQRPFGPTRRPVAPIGQGTWYLEKSDRRQAVAALRRGLDLGLTHVDTAEMYGSGAVERIVGEAIAGRREEVFLVSKVLPQNASRKGTVAACEGSLARLKTDRLDGYLLHWPGRHPLADTISAFEQLRRDGKILSWGVSNFDVAELEEVWTLAGERGGASAQGHAGGPVCNQVLYHLQERGIEHEVIPWCEAHGVAVAGYSPFGSGRFPGPRTRGGRVLEEIAAAHGATARQVALRFLVRAPSLFAIPKAARTEHAEDNAGAVRLELTPADIERIDQAFPRGPKPRALPTL